MSPQHALEFLGRDRRAVSAPPFLLGARDPFEAQRRAEALAPPAQGLHGLKIIHPGTSKVVCPERPLGCRSGRG
jgi:hypothetical protein